MKLTPKLSTNMTFPFWNSVWNTLPHQILSLKSGRYSGSLGAHQRAEEGVRNGRRGRLFIEKVCHQLSDRAANV
jgi:hypothetical protein